MKLCARKNWSIFSQRNLMAVIVCACAIASFAEMPTTGAGSSPAGSKLLKESDAAQMITLQDAFAMALRNHSKMLLAQNNLQRKRVENTMRIGAILPKLRLGGAYTRNIPEIEMNPFAQDSHALNRHVATLMRKSGDASTADQIDRQADLLERRKPTSSVVLSPKHVVDAKLTLEIPLFNGPDISRILASGEGVLMQESRLRDEEARTLFTTAKAYYLALYLKNILVLRERAESFAEERFLKATAEKKRGLIMEKDFLLAQAFHMQKQAERNGALLDYRSSLADLGALVGASEEFRVDDPDQMIFAPLSGDTEQLIATALNARPDLRAERQALRVVESERFGQFLQFMPVFTLLGDAKYTSNDRSMVGKSFTYAISVNAQMNIFDGGISIGQLRDSNLRRTESEIKLSDLRRDIDAKIRGRKERLVQLAMLESAAKMMADAYAEAEHVAQARQKSGLIDLERFLEVSDKRLNAEIAYKKALSDANEERLALIFEAGLLTPQFIQ